MAELRRKLVVVGDGACGMYFFYSSTMLQVPLRSFFLRPALCQYLTHARREDVSHDRILEGGIPSRVHSNCI